MRQCVFGILSLLLLQAQTCVPIPVPPDGGFDAFQDEPVEPETALPVEGTFSEPEVASEPEVVRYRLTINIVGDGVLTEFDRILKIRRDPFEFYAAGTTAHLTAWAGLGHIFSHWEEDSAGAFIEIVMDSDKTITAVFAEAFRMEIKRVGSGSINLPVPLPRDFTIGEENIAFAHLSGYAIGTEVTLTAVPDDAWRFVRWEKRGGVLSGITAIEWDAVGETTTDTVLTIVWDGPTKLTAVFEEDLTPIYTQAELAHFMEIVSDNAYIKRWETDIRITVSGSPTIADLGEVSTIIDELNSMFENAGATLRASLNVSNPNLEIIFKPLYEVDGLIIGSAGLSAIYIESRSLSWPGFDMVQSRPEVLRHEFMHNLGFAHSQDSASIMSTPAGTKQTYPDLDRAAIEMLYNSRVKFDMPMTATLLALDPLVIGGTGSISARVLPSITVEGGFCGCSQ